MKRLLAIILAAVLCLSVLAACGSNGGSAGGKITVEEQTVLDKDGVKAVVKDYGKFSSDMYAFDEALLIDVTNSSDKSVTVGPSALSINGYMFDSQIGMIIEPGKTQTVPVFADETALKRSGVTTIAELTFNLKVDDSDTYEALFESDPITVKTSAYEGFEFKYDESGTVLYDADGIKIVCKGFENDDFWGPCADIYVNNQTDKNICVNISEGLVNGKAVEDIFYGSEIYAGKRSVDLLTINEGERPAKLESLALSFDIFDNDSGELIVEKTPSVTASF